MGKRMIELSDELKRAIERFVPDPKGPPNKMDQLVYGADCARHPLLGCIIGHGNGDPNDQARNFLLSLRDATVHQTAGRAGDLSQAEYLGLLRELEAWERAGNQVKLPPRAIAIDHPLNHTRR
jgi:hypothetical protein